MIPNEYIYANFHSEKQYQFTLNKAFYLHYENSK